MKKPTPATAPAAPGRRPTPPRVVAPAEAAVTMKLTKRLRDLREMLLGERARILNEARKHAVTDQGEAHGDLADRSTDLSEREFQMELAEYEKVQLSRITKALGMIATGEYGICQECGEPISPKRLQALPTAEYCITCQAQLEREGLI